MNRVFILLYLFCFIAITPGYAGNQQVFDNSAFGYRITLPEDWTASIIDYKTPPNLDGHFVDLTDGNENIQIVAISHDQESFDRTWKRNLGPYNTLDVESGDIVISDTNSKWIIVRPKDPHLKLFALIYLVPGKEYNYQISIMSWNLDNYQEDRKTYESILQKLEIE